MIWYAAILCLAVFALRALCYCAGRPDAPLWLQAISYACCGRTFIHDDGPGSGTTGGYDPVLRSPSQFLGSVASGAGSGARRAAAASALLDEEDEEDLYDAEGFADPPPKRSVAKKKKSAQGGGASSRASAAMQPVHEDMEFDADAIYGRSQVLPDSDYDDIAPEDEVGPDDSISVAWYRQQADEPSSVQSVRVPSDIPASTPVTIETPDGTRHAMDVELEGVQDAKELRRGMLRAYNDLAHSKVASKALHVHARLANGTSKLVADDTPLTGEILRAVSFYVWTRTSGLD